MQSHTGIRNVFVVASRFLLVLSFCVCIVAAGELFRFTRYGWMDGSDAFVAAAVICFYVFFLLFFICVVNLYVFVLAIPVGVQRFIFFMLPSSISFHSPLIHLNVVLFTDSTKSGTRI